MNKTFPKVISEKVYKEFLDDYEGFLKNGNDIIKKHKEVIFEFITDNFSSYDIERDKWYHLHIGFDNIDQFRNHNKKKIEELTNKQVYELNALRCIIKEGNTYNMDKENMVPFHTRGFCWSKENRFIIFNER